MTETTWEPTDEQRALKPGDRALCGCRGQEWDEAEVVTPPYQNPNGDWIIDLRLPYGVDTIYLSSVTPLPAEEPTCAECGHVHADTEDAFRCEVCAPSPLRPSPGSPYSAATQETTHPVTVLRQDAESVVTEEPAAVTRLVRPPLVTLDDQLAALRAENERLRGWQEGVTWTLEAVLNRARAAELECERLKAT